MPEHELEALIAGEPPTSRIRQGILAFAFVMIMVPLIFIGRQAHDANGRADRASRSACTLVHVVDRQTQVIDSALEVLITPPGPERDRAIAELAGTVAADRATARKVERSYHC